MITLFLLLFLTTSIYAKKHAIDGYIVCVDITTRSSIKSIIEAKRNLAVGQRYIENFTLDISTFNATKKFGVRFSLQLRKVDYDDLWSKLNSLLTLLGGKVDKGSRIYFHICEIYDKGVCRGNRQIKWQK